jgi:hypothetical protein
MPITRETRRYEDPDSKGMISFKKGIDLYMKKWEENAIEEEFQRLIPIYPKKIYHLLLIGSPYRSDSAFQDCKETEDRDSILTESLADFETSGEGSYFETTRSNTMMTEAYDNTRAQQEYA